MVPVLLALLKMHPPEFCKSELGHLWECFKLHTRNITEEQVPPTQKVQLVLRHGPWQTKADAETEKIRRKKSRGTQNH